MATIVADTSALVSLGVVSAADPNPLDVILQAHQVMVPTQVIDELTETASFDDPSGEAAAAVLDRQSTLASRSVELDATFPLDDGENAAVTLANEQHAAQLLCDEFNQLALIHASLVESRLMTTPTLLVSLVHAGLLSARDAESCLDKITAARSWSTNSYVRRARETLHNQTE